jgi:rubrerythrin
VTVYEAETAFNKAFDDLAAGRTPSKEHFYKAWDNYREACEAEREPRLYCQFCGLTTKGNKIPEPICPSSGATHSYREVGVRS